MKHEPIEKYKLELNDLKPEYASEYKKIACTSCHTEVPAENININDKIAKCSHCHVVFSFHEEVASFLTKGKIKQEIIRPEGIDIFHFENDLDITIQQPLTIPETLLSIFIPLFALLFTFVFLVSGKLPIILPAIFWGLSFVSFVNLANRSKYKVYLNIDKQFLSIKWRPKKLTKDQHFPIHEIDQLYVKNLGGLITIFMTVNSAAGQKHVKLISGLDSLSKARYLEQEIENHLGIQDRHVPEESA